MKKMFMGFALCLLLATLVNPAYCSDHKEEHGYSGHFGDMDTNGDDVVDWKEFKKQFAHAEESVFKGIDTNGDGSIDHDEWHEFKEKHGYSHGKKHD